MTNKNAKMGKNVHAGVSLIIAIIFVSAFMLVIAGLAEAQLRTIRNVGNRETSGKAFYLAEAVEELALYWAATRVVGANSEDSDLSVFNTILVDTASAIGITNCEDIDSDAAGLQPCIGFEVSGRAAAADTIEFDGADYFSAPSKGTGNAGTCADSSDAEGDADQACNWNRLAVGETVEIPLFYEMPDGSVSEHNFASGDFKLRVRAPCENFNSPGFTGNCNWSVDGVDRIILYPPVVADIRTSPESAYRRVEDAPGISRDPVLVQWSISDMGGAGTSTLLARDNAIQDPPGSGIKRRVIRIRGLDPYRDQNTEISAGRINLAKDGLGLADPLENFIIVQYVPSGLDYEKHKGIDLNKNPQELGPYISTFSNPVLRLSLVGQPQKDDENPLLPQAINDQSLDVPYLEYQVLTNGIEISDSKSFIRAWAQVGDFRKEFRKELQREATLGGFAIEQF